MNLGTPENPLRVAVVGSGPAGFFAAESLFKSALVVDVDMFEVLPTPFGLVRYGVAPDHPQLKRVTVKFEKTAGHERFRFFGNVTVGSDIGLDELREYYDAVILSHGTPEHRRLGIPGEDLAGSHDAKEVINWYNGYPGYEDKSFNFDHETAVIIGNGNVALDAARVLSHTPGALAETDITAHSLRLLADCKVRHVVLVGRRGPVQASFTHQEIVELGKMSDCDAVVDPADLVLGAEDKAELEGADRIQNRRFWPLFEKYSLPRPEPRPRRLTLKFLHTPVAIEGDGRVERVVFERNRLEGEAGSRRAVSTGEKTSIDCGLVIRCIGYRGAAMDGAPFDERRGLIPNEGGRVTAGGTAVPGLYVTGWIKRGPSGVIGTNKADSAETVAALIADVAALTPCPQRESDALSHRLHERGVRVISFGDWKTLDAEEMARGDACGKPREKLVNVADMLALLDG
jgi:ferredoxin--NADP+ reductase